MAKTKKNNNSANNNSANNFAKTSKLIRANTMKRKAYFLLNTNQDCKMNTYDYHKKEIIPKTNKFYRNINSNKQISSIYKYATTYNITYLHRLIELLTQYLPATFYNKVQKLVSNPALKDDFIYSKLRLFHKNIKPVSYYSRFRCTKDQMISQQLKKYLERIGKLADSKSIKKLANVKYLDVGCGSGKFTTTFANELELSPDNTFGIDPDNYAEQSGWSRTMSDKFNFLQVDENTVFPFKDNMFDLITVKMVLHHVKDLDFTLKEIQRVLKKGGVLCIIDHDCFDKIDIMLCDIEHLLYTEVYNYDKRDKNKSKKEISGYTKYFNWIELEKKITSKGFNYLTGQMFNLNVKMELNPTRYMYQIYECK